MKHSIASSAQSSKVVSSQVGAELSLPGLSQLHTEVKEAEAKAEAEVEAEVEAKAVEQPPTSEAPKQPLSKKEKVCLFVRIGPSRGILRKCFGFDQYTDALDIVW